MTNSLLWKDHERSTIFHGNVFVISMDMDSVAMLKYRRLMVNMKTNVNANLNVDRKLMSMVYSIICQYNSIWLYVNVNCMTNVNDNYQ